RTRALGALDQVSRVRPDRAGEPAVVVTHLALIRVLWLTATGGPLADYHTVDAPHAGAFPIRWLGPGRIEPAGAPPS
ncbi:MAG: hypothetical protein ACRELC_14735, partial [Gemmatimonadota bacterium]